MKDLCHGHCHHRRNLDHLHIHDLVAEKALLTPNNSMVHTALGVEEGLLSKETVDIVVFEVDTMVVQVLSVSMT